MISFHITTIPWSHSGILILIQYYHLICHLYTNIPIMSFTAVFFLLFFPATTSRQVLHIAFNFYVYLFSFNIPLFRHIWCVLMIRFRLIIFDRNITKVVLCSFQCIISGCTQLVKVVSTRFLHCKGAFPPL